MNRLEHSCHIRSILNFLVFAKFSSLLAELRHVKDFSWVQTSKNAIVYSKALQKHKAWESLNFIHPLFSAEPLTSLLSEG